MNKLFFNLQFFAEDNEEVSTPPVEQEKTFSQDDVNRIIGERLIKERAKLQAEHEVALNKQREELELEKATFKASLLDKEVDVYLKSSDLPSELKSLLRYSTIEEFVEVTDKLQEAMYGMLSRRVEEMQNITTPMSGNVTHIPNENKNLTKIFTGRE